MGEQDMPTGPASDTGSGADGAATDGASGTAGSAAKRLTAGPRGGPSNPGKRRLGVMGGTFDPIHHGHLVAASEVAAQFHLDQVVFVPTGQPWQKTDRKVTPA
ncbi:nicotinate-nicotinamide nucleotide adenylyltransferase, partial [Streptomyces anthocyanicus]